MIGKALQDLIYARGTNVNELAKTADVSAQTLYSIIKRDNMKIDFDVLMKICKALNVPAEYFYNRTRGKDFLGSALATADTEDLRFQDIQRCYDTINEAGKNSLHQLALMHENNPNYQIEDKPDLTADEINYLERKKALEDYRKNPPIIAELAAFGGFSEMKEVSPEEHAKRKKAFDEYVKKHR